MTLGDDTGSIPASADPWNRGQVAGDAATDDPQRHEHRDSAHTVDAVEVARAWLAEDPDPDTRAELEALLDAGALAAVGERFAGRLRFGTAGLRGALGAGPMRMNRVVVIRAAAGLVSYLRVRRGRSVVIGFDARHKSEVFARDTADVVSGAGMRAWLLPRPLPTPVLAFAIRHLGADAGVMVTASHNPPQDNGYKVYLGDGAQIAPPADAEISAEIDAVGPLVSIPRAREWEVVDESLVDAYVRRAAAVAAPGGPRDLAIVATPLHGVGGPVVAAALREAGFADPYVVPEQAAPDPEFPTVSFPNPEEPGAMDLALAAAAARGADVVIANDPDADRCAVGVPARARAGWRMLRGDEVGALLGAHLLRRGERGTYAASVVSSSLLAKLAAEAGMPYAQTLTGFKWIARVPGLRYGYEEALGYCVDPDAVRDKDGVSAAVLVAEVAAAAKAAERTVEDLLDDLARRFGVHATDQLSVRVKHLGEIHRVMRRLRATPPRALGGRAVESVEDLATGVGGLPPTEGLRFRLAGGSWVVVRPSGTEPKLKCYLEVVTPVGDDDVAIARGRAADDLARIKADLAVAGGL